MRAGIGFDVHAFDAGRPLVLGGHTIDGAPGLGGHSDGDVLCHAVTDAILGAAALGDIGQHFPSSDEQWKDASSLDFVRRAIQMLSAVWMRVECMDATIVCEEPAIGPHRDAIKKSLADVLQIKVEDLSIKATTTDGLGFTGRREGIACYAVATLFSTV